MVNLQEWEHTGLCAICQGRKQFPVETEGLCSPSKVSRSICCLWLHHNCINKDSSSHGAKAAISSSIRSFIPASAVLPCKQRGSAGIYWSIPCLWMNSSCRAFTTQQISPQLEMGSGGAKMEIRSAPCSPQLGEVVGAPPSPALKIKWFGESSGSCGEGDDHEQLVVIVWLCGVSWCNFCLLCLPWMLFQV